MHLLVFILKVKTGNVRLT